MRREAPLQQYSVSLLCLVLRASHREHPSIAMAKGN